MPSRLTRLIGPRRIGAGLAAAAATAVVLGTLPGAGAARTVAPGTAGNDFSWPQCPKGVGNGQGQPLPRGHRQFMIVGLTNGQGLHENPCLASQWRFARNHADVVTGYAVVTYPTRRQRAEARHGHYGSCHRLRCVLRNNGWAQGEYVDQSLRQVGARPPMVWVDIEPRYQQPWTGHRGHNALVVRATIASLSAAGYRVGVYSTRYLWHSIVNIETRLPEWVPAASTSRGCALPLSHGPVWLSQFGHYYRSGNGYDENGLCRRAPSMHRMFQRAHPRVTVDRDSRTGHTFMTYSGGRRYSLHRTMDTRPVVAVANSAAGPLPVFAGVARGSDRLEVRTLGSDWLAAQGPSCQGQASAVTLSGQLWVACRSSDGHALLGSADLDRHGVPRWAPVLVDYQGALAASPALSVVGGVVVVRAEFTDGRMWQRSTTTEWQPAPAGAAAVIPRSAKL